MAQRTTEKRTLRSIHATPFNVQGRSVQPGEEFEDPGTEDILPLITTKYLEQVKK